MSRKLGRLENLSLAGDVDIVLIDARAIAGLSGRYRKSPCRTDVLAFDYGGGDPAGEIAISLDAAREQALERGMPLESELLLLALHGLLHLSGFDDEGYDGWCMMRRAEFETMMRAM